MIDLTGKYAVAWLVDPETQDFIDVLPVQILGPATPTRQDWLVQTFSWVDGHPVMQRIATIDGMVYWEFYDDVAAWNASCLSAFHGMHDTPPSEPGKPLLFRRSTRSGDSVHD